LQAFVYEFVGRVCEEGFVGRQHWHCGGGRIERASAV
jgi:hypothetical protein